MCEPLSVGVHACNRASVGPSTKVLILGAGPIGLVTLHTAHVYGSPKVVIASSISETDVDSEVLALQKAMGADIGGRVCLIGMGHNEMTLPFTPTATREVDILGVFRYCNTYPLCLDMLSSGRIDIKPSSLTALGSARRMLWKLLKPVQKVAVPSRSCLIFKTPNRLLIPQQGNLHPYFYLFRITHLHHLLR